jgi:acyl carrier protein
MADSEACRARTREIIQHLAPAGVTGCAPGDLLLEDLAFHSLALVELAFSLEEEFDLEPITYEQAQHIFTVGDVEEFVVAAILLLEAS